MDPLQLETENRELYLVKVPATLGAAWKKIQDSDLVLGSISLGKRDSTGRRKGILNIDPSSIEDELPTQYKMDMMPTGLKAKIFSQDGSGRMAVEGTVKESGNIMPQRNGEYSKLCKQRLIKSMVKDRYVQALEDLPKPSRNKVQFKIDAPVMVETENGNETKVVEKGDKKVKMQKDELKNIVFSHFEEKDFWPLKELNAHCRQPESFLKEVLKEICIYHRKGLNKSCYELKPQYKTDTQQEETKS